MKKRYTYIDYIKVLASISVTAVHFRNNVEKLIQPSELSSEITLFFSLNYSLFIFGVPLFLLCSGYTLASRNRANRKYIDVIKLFGQYFFMAVSSYFLLVLFKQMPFYSLPVIINKLLKFNLVSGWYIRTYILLILLVPYLNVVTQKLQKKTYQLLLITIVAAVTIPPFLNSFPPLNSITRIPNRLEFLYPFVYYLIGRYLFLFKEERHKFKFIDLLSFILLTTFTTIIVYLYANPHTWPVEGYYPSIILVVTALFLFKILRSVFNLDTTPRVIKILSKYTLTTYIMTYSIDRILFPVYLSVFDGPINLIKFMPLITIVTYAITVLSGIVLDFIYRNILNSIGSLSRKEIKH